MAFMSPDEFRGIVHRIWEGAHLDADFIGHLQAGKHPQLRAWGGYLQGLSSLRQKNFDRAERYFIDAQRQSVGVLRDLCTLSVARAVFWKEKLESQGKSSSRSSAMARLRALEQATARKSFKTDIQYYHKELGS